MALPRASRKAFRRTKRRPSKRSSLKRARLSKSNRGEVVLRFAQDGGGGLGRPPIATTCNYLTEQWMNPSEWCYYLINNPLTLASLRGDGDPHPPNRPRKRNRVAGMKYGSRSRGRRDGTGL